MCLGIKFQWQLQPPNVPARKLPADGPHYWEIGTAGYPLKRIVATIEAAGFEVVRTYRLFENIRHRFFVIQPVGVEH